MSTTNSIKVAVTLYSFEPEYFSYQWSFEEYMRRASQVGGGDNMGLEIIAPMDNPDYPHVGKAFEVTFKQSCERNNLTPVSYSIYSDHAIPFASRPMTVDESVDFMVCHFKTAVQLGFPKIRIQWHSYEIAEKLVPYAEKYKVWMGYEMHAPIMLGSEDGKKLVAQVKKVSSEYFGLIPDFAQFEGPDARGTTSSAEQSKPPRPLEPGEYMSQGVIVRADKPEDIRPLVPYVKHVHGKWHRFVKGQIVGMPYEELVRVFCEEKYNGSWTMEWEGRNYGEYKNGWEIVKGAYPLIKSWIAKYSKA